MIYIIYKFNRIKSFIYIAYKSVILMINFYLKYNVGFYFANDSDAKNYLLILIHINNQKYYYILRENIK